MGFICFQAAWGAENRDSSMDSSSFRIQFTKFWSPKCSKITLRISIFQTSEATCSGLGFGKPSPELFRNVPELYRDLGEWFGNTMKPLRNRNGTRGPNYMVWLKGLEQKHPRGTDNTHGTGRTTNWSTHSVIHISGNSSNYSDYTPCYRQADGIFWEYGSF